MWLGRRRGALRIVQLQPAEDHEQQGGDGQVEGEAGQEDLGGARREPGLGDEAVDDAAIDADRREAAGLGAVDHHQPHHHRIDPVLGREGQRHRRQDRHRRRPQRPEGGQGRGDQEHHPGNGDDVAAHQAHRALHQPVDRAVLLGDGEQVGHAHQGHEEVAWEAREDLLGGQAEAQHADEERRRQGQGAHVQRQHRRQQEHHHQGDDG